MQATIVSQLRYQWRKAHFRYRTWCNSRQIAEAYRSDRPRWAVPRWIVRPVLIVFALVTLLVIGWLLVPDAVGVMSQALRRSDGEVAQEVKDAALDGDPVFRAAAEETSTFSASSTSLPERTGPAEAATRFSIDRPSLAPVAAIEYILVANKATLSIHLLRLVDDSPQLIKCYSVAVGRETGQKQTSGDRKTPTGYYYIVGRKEGYEVPRQYGPLVYVLNYPNEDDRRAGRKGQGIWIHGSLDGTPTAPTKGCLRLHNEDLTELALCLKLGIGTPVVIVDQQDLGDPAAAPDYARLKSEHNRLMTDYRKAHQALTDLIADWEGAWEGRDIEAYAGFYDTAGFRGSGLRWDAWRARKLRTFRRYQKIEIEVDRIVLTELSDSAATVKFRQKYSSDALRDESAKKLAFAAVASGWRIIGETTIPQEEPTP